MLDEIKESVAKELKKESWADLKDDFDQGFGLSNRYSFEEIMDLVAKRAFNYKPKTIKNA